MLTLTQSSHCQQEEQSKAVATAQRRRCGDGAPGAPYRAPGAVALVTSCQSCHFDMGGGDSAVGTNALARDALASILVPLQSRRTVGGKRAGHQRSVKLMCNTVAYVEECCIANTMKKY